ncbi:MAG TPA: methyl-accepting chemotaxis protein [Gemmatimonadaceae bacterium]|nr:methyl-accepting chemotaxis protein [Gemmatimonadaceae bacterium]
MTLSSITSTHAVPRSPRLQHEGRGPVRSPSAAHSKSLQRAIVVGAAIAAVVVLGVATLFGMRTAAGVISDRADARLRDVARRGELVTEQALLERARQVELIGAAPTIVEAARTGAARAAQMGLVGKPIEAVERAMAATRTMAVSETAKRFLQRQLAPLGVAEMFVTDANGFNVVTTEMTSDFVQSDEAWWRDAVRKGLTNAEAEFDESAGQTVVSMAGAINDGERGRADGVLKIAFGIASLDAALAKATGDDVRLDVIDARGRVVASSARDAQRMKPLPGSDQLPLTPGDTVVRFGADDGTLRAMLAPANSGAWRVIAHVDESSVLASLRAARPVIAAALAGVLAFIVATLWVMARFLDRRISAPVTELATIAEAVASGDLSTTMVASSTNDEVGRLSRATAAMMDDLRRVVSALRDSARETSARAAEITGGSEHMAAAAQEMAVTSGDLSRQSTEMADAIQRMAGDASRLQSIADQLASGAHDGVERNAALSALAKENRQRFDASAVALEHLASDARASADAVKALAEASEEFGAFVTLVQKMAKQSKLLALNAAMEAARAGEHGQGFAVVASEVRRLAANSADAAQRTETLVRGVLAKVQESRELSSRTMDTVIGVLETTQLGMHSFAQVEDAVRGSETWTASIEYAATTSRELVSDVTTRLDEVAKATESYASAMQEVAASSEEQSASTEQIAAAAASLAEAAAHMAGLVGGFKLEGSTGEMAIPRPPESDAKPNALRGAPTFQPA